jgi:hypothetical protein
MSWVKLWTLILFSSMLCKVDESFTLEVGLWLPCISFLPFFLEHPSFYYACLWTYSLAWCSFRCTMQHMTRTQ